MSQELENQKNHGPFSRGEVIEIINSVMTMMQKDEASTNAYKELQDLIVYIQEAKMEISSIKTDEINDKHIPDATDELDAVIGATEEATGAIMDACEVIESATNTTDTATQEKVMAEITKIYEACGFQDITGQRITKVVGTLKAIEEQVTHIVETLSTDLGIETVEQEAEEKKEMDDSSLLNGPQMPGQGVSQDEIDALLASFD